jgi:hypothetical protein
VNSSTSSSRRWLQIFFAIVVTASAGILAASEWLIRAQVLRGDNFEWIAARLRNSTQSNASFGDSHVAAVPDYNAKDFVNLGVGATTIRKMDQRVRYYFSKIKPGEVIIQADPHLFADYRLEAQGSYVPETYSKFRLRAFDPQHRGFMLNYWIALLAKGRLKALEVPDYDQLWRTANSLQKDAAKPAEEASRPAAAATKAPQETAQPPEEAARPTAEVAKPSHSPPAIQAMTASAVAEYLADTHGETLSKFNAFMDYEVSAHTPVLNFRERAEANIYRDMIKFLVARGAKVCLMNYPVDKFYRERADAIPAFAAVRKFYQEVAQENHIPYVSFWDRFDDPSMYQNTDHVNENGSQILVREARQACFGKPAP